MRNLLEEFHADHGLRPPSILGVREHVFTGRFGIHPLKFINEVILLGFAPFSCLHIECSCFCSVSSLAWFMSNQETSFVTLAQRVLANPLK